MDESKYEARVGIFRRQALDHLAEAHAVAGGVVPRVVPYVAWTVATVTMAVAILIATLAVIQVEEHVSSKAMLNPFVLVPRWTGHRVTVTFPGPERDSIKPGQKVSVQLEQPGARVEAIVETVSGHSSAEGGEYRFPVVIRLTSEPKVEVAFRDQPAVVRIVVRTRSALAALFGFGS